METDAESTARDFTRSTICTQINCTSAVEHYPNYNGWGINLPVSLVSSSPSDRFAAGLYRLPDGAIISANDSGEFCSFVSPAHFEFISGQYDLVQSVDGNRLSAMANHGACAVRLPAGAYRLADGRIIASNGSAFCRYVSYEHYERKDRRPIKQFNGEIPLHGMENHFDCAQ